MSDPLSLLRQAVMSGAPLENVDGSYQLGSFTVPQTSETCFRRSLAGDAKYYTVKDVLFYLNNSKMTQTEYRKAVMSAKCIVVIPADQNDLIAYLKGEVDTLKQLNLEKAAASSLDVSVGAGGGSTKGAIVTAASAKEKENKKRHRDSMSSKEGKSSSSKKDKSSRSKSKVSTDVDSDDEEKEEEVDDGRKKPDYVSSGQLKTDLMNALVDSSTLPSADVVKADRLHLNAALKGNMECQNRWTVLQTKDKTQSFAFAKRLFHENVRKYIERDKKKGKLLVDIEIEKLQKSGTQVKPAANNNRKKGNPIIIVPSALSALVNGSNIESFLMGHKYAPVDSSLVAHRQNIPRVYPHPVTQEPVEYDIKVIDNPTFDDGSFNKALSDEQWDCVVAVFVTGQAWQFKGWKWDNPTFLFQHVLGVHICFNDTAPHANIAKWNCKVLKIGRYERHQDTVVVNKFWEMFDEFARVNNKPVSKKHRAEDYQ